MEKPAAMHNTDDDSRSVSAPPNGNYTGAEKKWNSSITNHLLTVIGEGKTASQAVFSVTDTPDRAGAR